MRRPLDGVSEVDGDASPLTIQCALNHDAVEAVLLAEVWDALLRYRAPSRDVRAVEICAQVPRPIRNPALGVAHTRTVGATMVRVK